MSTSYEMLLDIKNALSTVAVSTIRIGIEEDISPDDYPLIRIVPETTLPGQPSIVRTRLNFTLYCGVPILPQDSQEGLEKVYEELDKIDIQSRRILESNTTFRCNWEETIWDQDNIEGGYKLLASRYYVIK